jgi:alpha-beta hydrolase superfamily lysophospholipase
MNPSQGGAAPISIDIRVDRDTVLPGRVWCAQRPRALVAIVHGIGEHSGRYTALASDLVKGRFTCVALDLPGHGESNGPRGDIPS